MIKEKNTHINKTIDTKNVPQNNTGRTVNNISQNNVGQDNFTGVNAKNKKIIPLTSKMNSTSNFIPAVKHIPDSIEVGKIKSLNANYISFMVIVKDEEFVKLIDPEILNTKVRKLLKLDKASTILINWKLLDIKLLEFMRNKVIKRSKNLSSEENFILKYFEAIENQYQYYHKHKNVKENLKNLDNLIPRKEFYTHVKTMDNFTYKSENPNCTENCVKICKNNFNNVYNDFIQCAKIACLCLEFNIIRKN